MDQVDEPHGDHNGGGDIAHCPGCMAENSPGAAFCEKCGMPIGMIATLDPIQSIHSTGWLYRRAISGGHRKMALWGMWFLFGPALLALIYQISQLHSFVVHGGSATAVIGFFFTAGLGVLYAAILFRMTRSYVRERRRAPGTCKVCGYNLMHLRLPRCPECGTSFSQSELENKTAEATLPMTQDLPPQREGEVDWKTPDISCVPEARFPIDCTHCEYNLTGIGEWGLCPECGTEFDREQRLLELYGPDVFVLEEEGTHERRADGLRLGRAMWTTGLAIAAVAIGQFLVQEGYVAQDRMVLAILLFVPAGLEWFRVFRDVFGGTQEDEESEQDGV